MVNSVGRNMLGAIIGANGFVGSALMRYVQILLVQQKNYVGKGWPQRNVTEWIPITRDNYDLWKSKSFSVVIWAAGNASKRECNQDPSMAYYSNAIGVLDALREFNPLYFVYISSQSIYGSTGSKESDVPNLKNLDAYGGSKYLGEKIIQDSDVTRTLIVRPNGFTGPRLKKNIVYDLAHGNLYNTWDSAAQYIHVDLFAYILLKMIVGRETGVYNLTSPDVITATDVADILGVDKQHIKQPSGENSRNYMHARVDVSKLIRFLEDRKLEIPSSEKAVRKWNEPYQVPVPEVQANVGRSFGNGCSD